MITSNDSFISQRCSSIRSRGLDLDSSLEIFSSIGTNQRMTEIQALMGLTQLRRLEDFVRHRNEIAQIYDDLLGPLFQRGTLRTTSRSKNIKNSFWRYVLFLLDSTSRVALRDKTDSKNIKIDWAYQPLVHLQPAIREMFGDLNGLLPTSEALAQTHFCLPIHLGIRPADAESIAKDIRGMF